ncbi:3'(2'),5'-bisphosphate nucleotidase CysQ [Antribacter gilvus]|uniref:3'(2'),5'-bisphosphate nucleotidase CysQ n=1 Tax=Antribacter gilvus TaxID=2304675 RepID=UPI000F7694AA|nr:3'(2'),5'-bisphosphate nucleotidase CysQ [Antribacter gilvus]
MPSPDSSPVASGAPLAAPERPGRALDDAALAVALAHGAGEVLLGLRQEVDAAGVAFEARALKDAGDAAAQAWLAAALAATRPGDAILSEEAEDGRARLSADRVWIIDPLDGTREFAERTDDGGWRDDFAVHVALWERGAGLTAGAVALPGRGLVRSTAEPGRSTAEPGRDTTAEPAGPVAGRPLRVAASRTRPPAFVAALAARGDVELVPMGSAGVKVMAVVSGEADAYVHSGGQFEWDSAAPVAVAEAAGLVCTRLDGSALEYNRPDPWLPDLVVCPSPVEARLRELLASVGVQGVSENIRSENKEGARS